MLHPLRLFLSNLSNMSVPADLVTSGPASGIGGKGGMVVGVIWAENALSLGLILLRMYTRRFVKGRLGWDDLCLVITWVRQQYYCLEEEKARSYGHDT